MQRSLDVEHKALCEFVYVHVLACAMHFKEFLMTVKK